MSLSEERLRLFFKQFAANYGYGWQSEVARRTGIHQTHVGRIANGDRGASPATIEAVQRGFALAPAFFNEPDLGVEPDFGKYVDLDEPMEMVRDDAAGIDVVEAFIAAKAAAKEPIAERHQLRLRGLRGKLGGVTVKPLALEGWYNGMVADEHTQRVTGSAKEPEISPGRKKVEPPRRR